MKAMILAAGYATRLYPLTLDRPKALLPINGKPIIDYIIDELNEICHIDRIYVITNELFAKDFYDWEQNLQSAIPVEVVSDNTTSESDKLGAIGDMWFCINKKNIAEDTIIIAGDNFFSFALKDFYEFYNIHKKDCVCVEEINDKEKLSGFAVALLDYTKNNKIVDLVEKPPAPKSNIAVFAIYMYKKETIALVENYLKDGNKPDSPGHFVEWLYKRQDVLGYKVKGNCFDIGTLAGYEQVQELVKEGKIKGG